MSFAPEQFYAGYKFPLDDFQREAVEHLAAGRSVLVVAPTSAGKTIIAEYAIESALYHQRAIVYTTPLKALSNQKFRDFSARYGEDQVGIVTGDVNVNPYAPIVVMTTEILRNMLLGRNVTGDEPRRGFDIFVFDEFHYLADPERGRVWEETILLCPTAVQIVALSATVTNAEEIRTWLSDRNGDFALIRNDRRPVPLDIFYAFNKRIEQIMDADGHLTKNPFAEEGTKKKEPRRIKPPERHRGHRGRYEVDEKDEYYAPDPAELLKLLQARNMLPCLYFVFSRRGAEDAAHAALRGRTPLPLVRDVTAVREALQRVLGRLNVEDRELAQVRRLRSLIERGIAFHHAGLLPPLKELVENLFAGGYLSAVFSTDTLSLGINMPARTVILERLTKFDGKSRRPVNGREFRQMVGRAGRRGIDQVGHAVILYDRWMPFATVSDLITQEPEPVESAFRLMYSSLLNLIQQYHRPALVHLLENSFLMYQLDKRVVELKRQIEILTDQLVQHDPNVCLVGLVDVTLGEYERRESRVRSLKRQINTLKEEREAIIKERRGAADAVNNRLNRRERHALMNGLPEGAICVIGRQASPEWALYLDGYFIPLSDFLIAEARIRRLGHEYLVAVLPAENDTPLLAPLLSPKVEMSPEVTMSILDQVDVSKLKDLAALLPDLPAWYEAHITGPRLTEFDARASQVGGVIRELEETLHEQRERLENYPCHKCTVLNEHRKLIASSASKRKNLQNQERTYRELSRLRQNRVEGELSSVEGVLTSLGFLAKGAPTHAGQILAGIFHQSGPAITMLSQQPLVRDLDAAEIAELFSWVVEARVRDEDLTRRPPRFSFELQTAWELLISFSRDLAAAELRAGREVTTLPVRSLPHAARRWCSGVPFGEMCELYQMEEGDMAGFLLETINVLRQLEKSLVENQTELDLVPHLRAAQGLMRRDLIATMLDPRYTEAPEIPDDAP